MVTKAVVQNRAGNSIESRFRQRVLEIRLAARFKCKWSCVQSARNSTAPQCSGAAVSASAIKHEPRSCSRSRLAARLHPDRTAGGNRHHRHPCRNVAAGPFQGQIQGLQRAMLEQQQAASTRVDHLLRGSGRPHGQERQLRRHLAFAGGDERYLVRRLDEARSELRSAKRDQCGLLHEGVDGPASRQRGHFQMPRRQDPNRRHAWPACAQHGHEWLHERLALHGTDSGLGKFRIGALQPYQRDESSDGSHGLY